MGTRTNSRYAEILDTERATSAQECGAGSWLLQACCIGIRLPFALASAVGTIRLIHEYGTIRKQPVETIGVTNSRNVGRSGPSF